MLTQAQYEAVVEDLASSIEAPLVQAIDAQREAIVADLGWITRFVAVRMWSAVLKMVPILARVALSAILGQFGRKTVNEIMDLIFAHRAAESQRKGPPS